MKAYLLFDNEETKENFSTLTWGHVKNNSHEIDIPDGAYECHGHFHNHQGRTNSFCIPIYHPKKKVKKCQYITIGTDHCGRKRAEVTGWLTEIEAMARALEPEDRIYQTEIEVEE